MSEHSAQTAPRSMDDEQDLNSYTIINGEVVPLEREPRAVAVKYAPRAARFSSGAEVVRRFLGPDRKEQIFIAEYGLKVFTVDDAMEPKFIDPLAATRALEELNAAPEVEYATPVYRQSEESDTPMFVTNRILIRFRDDVGEDEQADLHAELGGTVVERLGYVPIGVVVELHGRDAANVVAIANQYSQSPLIEWANPDFVKRLARRAIATDVTTPSSDPASDQRIARCDTAEPNRMEARSSDRHWHLEMVDIAGAWSHTRGKRAVRIAVTDDGVDIDHPEFATRIVSQYDFANKTADAMPKSRHDKHGTAVASVAAAAGHKAAGVAPECSIIAVRTPGYLGTRDEARMFEWCGEQRAAVINCSWGPQDNNGPFRLADATAAAIRNVVDRGRDGKGIPVVFAAGNGDEPVAGDGYASFEKVIAVAATTSEDTRASYSDYGRGEVFIAAPSSGGRRGVFTADRRGNDGYNPGSGGPHDDFDYFDGFGGTSSAAPLVAGLIGLMISENDALTEGNIRAILAQTAEKIGNASDYGADGKSEWYGHGRVNAARALAEARRHNGSQPSRSPTITGPERIAASDPPPSFSVDTAGRTMFAVEVATEASLFNGSQSENLRTGTNFFGSWENGLSTTSPYTLPDDVWNRLDKTSTQRLFYRVHVADDADWSNYAVSVPDAEAQQAGSILIGEASSPDVRPQPEPNAPSISAPASRSFADAPPVFSINKGGRRLYAVEVATEARLLGGGLAADERSAENFFGSWERELSESTPYTLPQEVWSRLRSAARLFYRAHFADDANWTNYATTLSDEDAFQAPSMAITQPGGQSDNRSLRPREMVYPSGARFETVAGENARDQENPAGGGVPLITIGNRGRTRVSADFSIEEYSGAETTARVDPKMVEAVQAIRTRLGHAVKIAKGYTRPSVDSDHASGLQVAIHSDRATPQQLNELAEEAVRVPFSAIADGSSLVLSFGVHGRLADRAPVSGARMGPAAGVNLIAPETISTDETLSLYLEASRPVEITLSFSGEAMSDPVNGAARAVTIAIDGAGVFTVPDSIRSALSDAAIIAVRADTAAGAATPIHLIKVEGRVSRMPPRRVRFRSEASFRDEEEAVRASSSAPSQTTDLVIKVQLPSNRWQSGLLRLERSTGEIILQDINVYGKADNSRAAAEGNPNRNTTLPYGDTPEGTYSAPRAVATGHGTAYSAYSYGPHGAIVLAPEAGDAKTAKDNGRVGLLIHGGDLNSQGKLRATHGCLRLSNGDMKRLIDAIREAGNNPILQRCEIVDVSVLVGPEGVDEPGSDESDPPPGIEALLSPTSSPLL